MVELKQSIIWIAILLTFGPTVINGNEATVRSQSTYLSSTSGCVAFIYDNNYERLCQTDDFGKSIWPEPDLVTRITVFSGFPDDGLEDPFDKAIPNYKQEYEWTDDYDEVWVDEFGCLVTRVMDMLYRDRFGSCPPSAYVGVAVPNPYKMKKDGTKSIPLKLGLAASVLGGIETALVENSNLGVDPYSNAADQVLATDHAGAGFAFWNPGDGENVWRRNLKQRRRIEV